jgi:hypothetical protein
MPAAVRARALVLALFALGAAACAPLAPAPAAAPQSLVLDRLYFGRSIPGGGSVSDDDWSVFLRDSVTPRFPDGLTVWRAEGQWREASGAIVREASFVLEIVHADDAVSEQAVQRVRADYRTRFRQEAVLRVSAPVRVQF